MSILSKVLFLEVIPYTPDYGDIHKDFHDQFVNSPVHFLFEGTIFYNRR